MTTFKSNRLWAYERPLALLILAGSMTSPALASGEEAAQQRRITEVPQIAATGSAGAPISRLSAKEIAETKPLSTGVDPSRRGVTIRPVQYQYRTVQRPVYSTPPAQAPAQTYTYAPQPARVASAFAQGSPWAVPMMVAPYFAQPVRQVYNNWQQGYGQQAYQQQPAYYQQPAVNYGYGGGDAYGFTSWLNSVRAQYGLRPVGYDSSLESWAAANNAQQNSRGLGHYVMGPASRQNSAMGSADTIRSQWMNSPAHRAALLDPNISSIGLSGSGSYWTFNAR